MARGESTVKPAEPKISRPGWAWFYRESSRSKPFQSGRGGVAKSGAWLRCKELVTRCLTSFVLALWSPAPLGNNDSR